MMPNKFVVVVVVCCADAEDMTEVERMRIIPTAMIEKNILEIDKTEDLQKDATISDDMRHAMVGITF